MAWIRIEDRLPSSAAAVVLACIAAGCVSKTDDSASTGGDTAVTDPGSAGSDAAPTSGAIGPTTSATASTASTDIGTTQAATGDADATDDGSSAGGSSTTSGTNACEPQPWFQCTEPFDCRGEVAQNSLIFGCGGVSSFFDDQGCPRQLCQEDGDCPAGTRCHDPVECDRCLSVNAGCGDTEYQGRTICGCAGDGACGSRVCVPTDQYPPGYCDPE